MSRFPKNHNYQNLFLGSHVEKKSPLPFRFLFLLFTFRRTIARGNDLNFISSFTLLLIFWSGRNNTITSTCRFSTTVIFIAQGHYYSSQLRLQQSSTFTRIAILLHALDTPEDKNARHVVSRFDTFCSKQRFFICLLTRSLVCNTKFLF